MEVDFQLPEGFMRREWYHSSRQETERKDFVACLFPPPGLFGGKGGRDKFYFVHM